MKTTIASVLSAVLISGPSFAAVMSYNFFQGGFDDGASVTGMFTGEDRNGDGQITYFNTATSATNEVSSFMLEFSGNSIVPAFTADLSNITGFIWDDGPATFGDGVGSASTFREGLRANFSILSIPGTFFRYESGFSPLGPGPVKGRIKNLSLPAQTTESTAFGNISAKAVPSNGSTLAMFGLGLASLGWFKGRQGRSA